MIEEVYPPSITVKAVSSQVPKHLRRPRHVCLRVSGTSKGELTFPVEVSEEKEGELYELCVWYVCAHSSGQV